MRVRSRSNEDWRSITAAAVVVGTLIISLVLYGHDGQPKLAFSHKITIIVAAELLVFMLLLRRRILEVLRTFFCCVTHPLNLALFRIVVFWGIFREVHLATITSFSRIPAGLQVAPWGMGRILGHLPINPRWAASAGILLLIFSLTGLIGLFSRTSALLCVLLGLYALGIPQFYGKVDHYNHLIWFAALLAVSPCGSLLAVDAIFAARRRADRGTTEPPEASQEYALPLRVAALLLGVIYFFPGFWKLWDGGLDWILSDNLQRQLHLFWTWSLKCAWLPSFRIDQHPLLCAVGAAGVVCFELSFVWLVFSARLRKLAALAGLAFHGLVFEFMHISFSSLQWSYVVLFDWSAVFGTIGRWLYPEDMLFFFDGDCRACRRTVAALRVCDIFERVSYINLCDRGALGDAEAIPANLDPRKSHVRALIEGEEREGFAAYRLLAERLPILWPAIPILYLLPPGIVSRISRETSETHSRAVTGGGSFQMEFAHKRTGLSGIVALGTALVLVCTFCGANKIVSGWPFACYPTFSSPAPETLDTLVLIAGTASGGTFPVEIRAISYDRLYWVFENILATGDPQLQQDRLRELWGFAVQSDPRLRKTMFVKFYQETWSTIPERWKNNPVDRRLLFEIDLSPSADLVVSGESGTGPLWAACLKGRPTARARPCALR